MARAERDTVGHSSGPGGAMPILFILVITIVVLLLLSAWLSATSQPKGAVLEFLTSSAPGERVLDWRTCNACLADAEPSRLAQLVMLKGPIEATAEMVLKAVRKMMGGLWVGGRVFLTTHRVVFVPNALNRALHNSLSIVVVKLADVTGVVSRFGLFTRIVDVKTAQGTLTVRGHAMKKFARAIDGVRAGA